MIRLVRVFIAVIAVITVLPVYSATLCAQPEEKDIQQAMKKATDFMMNTVSTRGGFVWQYLADLSNQWGEVPARKTMIWVQNPGTVGVGMMLLDAYKATGDLDYLTYAEKPQTLSYGVSIHQADGITLLTST